MRTLGVGTLVVLLIGGCTDSPLPPASTAVGPTGSPSSEASVPASFQEDPFTVPADVLEANTSTRGIQAVSVGWSICAIKLDGTIGCWGDVSEAPPGGTFVAISNGDGSTCAIRATGEVACWGMIGSKVPEGRFLAVAVAQSTACGIAAAETVTCWVNPEPESGAAELEISHPVAGTLKAISVGSETSCGIRADDTLSCWGGFDPDLPSVASGTYTALDVPYAIATSGEIVVIGPDVSTPPPGRFVDVSSGPWGGTACARRADGTIACWGPGGMDDFGNDLPMRSPAGSFSAVSVGERSACVIRLDRRVSCWGEFQDAVRPTASTVVSAPTWTKNSAETVRWSAAPLFAPVTGYDVESWTNLEYGGEPPADPDAEPSRTSLFQATTMTSASLTGRPGSTVCVRARAHDADGAVSTWASTCTTFPLDEVTFQPSGTWQRLTDPRFYLGSALGTSQRGATLTLTGVGTFGVGLLVTTCPGCGTVQMALDGQPTGEPVSLQSSKLVDRVIVGWGDNGEEGFSGTLTITVESAGSPVIIDGALLGPGPEG